jgi:hypothetical protein
MASAIAACGAAPFRSWQRRLKGPTEPRKHLSLRMVASAFEVERQTTGLDDLRERPQSTRTRLFRPGKASVSGPSADTSEASPLLQEPPRVGRRDRIWPGAGTRRLGAGVIATSPSDSSKAEAAARLGGLERRLKSYEPPGSW